MWTTAPSFASVGSSLESLAHALGSFFSNLAAVDWPLLALALLLNLGYMTARSRAIFNIQRAAYPDERFRWRSIFGADVAGHGINNVIPLHAGDVVKLYLARHRIPNSGYVTIGSGWLMLGIFDILMAVAVMGFAATQGVLPSLPDLPSLPAFDISFWAGHPQFLLLVLTVIGIGIVVAFALLVKKVRAFWSQAGRGWTIFADRRRYLRQVAGLQFCGWLCRLSSLFVFLAAFHMPATVRNALLVMAVASLTGAMPLTPNGAGAQQAILAFVFAGTASSAQVLSFAVGTQLSLIIANAALGFGALLVMVRTMDYKAIVRRGRAERTAEKDSAPQEHEKAPTAGPSP